MNFLRPRHWRIPRKVPQFLGGVASHMHLGRLNAVQHKGARFAKDICIAQLNLLYQSVEHLVTLEVIVQDGGLCGEMANGAALIEHVPILHIESQPQIEPVVLRDEVRQARTEGLAQAFEQLSEGGGVFVRRVPLDEQCMTEGPMCLPKGE